jgi:hypothetical protein
MDDTKRNRENCRVRGQQAGKQPRPDGLEVREAAYDSRKAMVDAGQMAFDFFFYGHDRSSPPGHAFGLE